MKNGSRGKTGIGVGELDKRIVIQGPTYTTDTTGESIESWSTVATVWSKFMVQNSVGTERFETDQLVSVNTSFFLIRYRTDINSTQRISYNSETWSVQAVADMSETENVPRKTWLKIRVEHRDNENNSK